MQIYSLRTTMYQPGINLVLGFNYVISDKFVFEQR